jgi:hypothetical protein
MQVGEPYRPRGAIDDVSHDIAGAADLLLLALLDPVEIPPVHHLCDADRIAAQQAQVSARMAMPAGQPARRARELLAAFLEGHDLRRPPIEQSRQCLCGQSAPLGVERDDANRSASVMWKHSAPAGSKSHERAEHDQSSKRQRQKHPRPEPIDQGHEQNQWE